MKWLNAFWNNEIVEKYFELKAYSYFIYNWKYVSYKNSTCLRKQESVFVHYYQSFFIFLIIDASVSVFIMYEIVSMFLLFDTAWLLN